MSDDLEAVLWELIILQIVQTRFVHLFHESDGKFKSQTSFVTIVVPPKARRGRFVCQRKSTLCLDVAIVCIEGDIVYVKGDVVYIYGVIMFKGTLRL